MNIDLQRPTIHRPRHENATVYTTLAQLWAALVLLHRGDRRLFALATCKEA
jgi:hypothetical protein